MRGRKKKKKNLFILCWCLSRNLMCLLICDYSFPPELPPCQIPHLADTVGRAFSDTAMPEEKEDSQKGDSGSKRAGCRRQTM